MGFEFLENFTQTDLISIFGRMLLNKLDILNNNQKIGLGVFIDVCKYFHSCKPTAIKTFDCNKLIIKLIDNLETKNDVKISFCDPDLNYCERNNYLKKNYYLFECNCIKCRQDKVNFKSLVNY